MKRVFYVPDEKKEIIKSAENALREGILKNIIIKFDTLENESISSVVVKFLETIVKEHDKRKKEYKVHELNVCYNNLKLIGKKLAEYEGTFKKVEQIRRGKDLFVQSADSDKHIKFTAYQTIKSGRLFIKIKIGKSEKNSELSELHGFWEDFYHPQFGEYEIESVYGDILLPDLFIVDICEALKSEIEDYFIID